MNPLVQALCLGLFLVLVVAPALYGLHMYVLLALAHRRRPAVREEQRRGIEDFHATTPEAQWPVVTTQLPMYNELTVAQRVIEAAARMDYPAGRHEVQVLDDSTDESRAIIERTVAALVAQGHDVKIVRRPNREHYKAGALAYGTKVARGEFLAVFDADFVPDKGFLRRMVPLIARQDDACCVQGRWGHLNPEESWITQGLALGLDMHFAIEQGARAWNGLLLNFNGTAGIWRKAAVEDEHVGGWQGDTITEDLDLSYRAQLCGWKVVYCADEVCPAELPADVDALKSQQRRWATGSIQTARKLLPAVWRSKISLIQKLEATLHLTQYAIAVPMIFVAMIGRLLPYFTFFQEYKLFFNWTSFIFLTAAAAPTVAYVYSRWAIGGGLPGPLRILKLMVLGLGLCVNNGIAVLVGLFQRGGEFVRTPKTGARGAAPTRSVYASFRSRLWMVEMLLGAFCLAQWLYFLRADNYIGGVYLLLYAIGLLLLGWGSRPRARLEAAPPGAVATA